MPTDTLHADPLLLALADNGGPTRTHALARGSPAIDAGNNLLALANDQRGAGFPRAVGRHPISVLSKAVVDVAPPPVVALPHDFEGPAGPACGLVSLDRFAPRIRQAPMSRGGRGHRLIFTKRSPCLAALFTNVKIVDRGGDQP